MSSGINTRFYAYCAHSPGIDGSVFIYDQITILLVSLHEGLTDENPMELLNLIILSFWEVERFLQILYFDSY